MKLKLLTLLTIALFTLSGCDQQPQVKYQYKVTLLQGTQTYKTIYQKDRPLFGNCRIWFGENNDNTWNGDYLVEMVPVLENLVEK